MNKGLTALEGDNISQAVAELGYPNGQESIMGQTVYIWDNSQTVDIPMTTTGTTTGYVNGAPYSSTTTSTDYVPQNYNCTIQIAVDSNGTIVHTQWAGNIGGCMSYSNELTRNN